MTRIIQSPKDHENILKTKASLEWGNTYSLFFDLATKDLWRYFTDTSITIDGIDQKAKIFGRTIGLAGALAFLHEELYVSSRNEQLQCYHLDLKPQNILVFEAGGNDGDDIWKISDFGMSRIKTVRDGQPHPESEHFLDMIFKPQHNEDSSSGIENARAGGTYAAPEAREESAVVTRKSDVWSLGCVLALVLTFLDGQSRGINEFSQARQKDRKHDWFFDSKAVRTGSDEKQILHPSVSTWLRELTRRAFKRGISEGTAIQKASEMLVKEMLIRDQGRRLSAKKVEEKLKNIQSCFTEPAVNLQKTNSPPELKRQLKIPHLPLRSRRTQQSSKHTKSLEKWNFELPKAAKRCLFSPDGTYLIIVSSESVVIKSTADIQHERTKAITIPQNEKPWMNFSVGSKYLCITSEPDYFGVLQKSSKICEIC